LLRKCYITSHLPRPPNKYGNCRPILHNLLLDSDSDSDQGPMPALTSGHSSDEDRSDIGSPMKSTEPNTQQTSITPERNYYDDHALLLDLPIITTKGRSRLNSKLLATAAEKYCANYYNFPM